MANLATNLPVLKTPYLDTNGQITQPWLMFLVQLYQRTGGDQTPPLNLTQVQQTYLNAVNILSSNGFAGSITYTTNTANVTLSTTVTGITKGNGTALSAAVSGTDYSLPVLISSANGFAGTVVNGTSNATVTMKTTITGLLKGNGTAISAAVSGVDYAPPTSGTSILYGNGAGGFSNVTIGSGVSFTGGTLSATGSGGTVTSVTGTTPISSSGGTTPNISISQATTSTNGYLSSTDWNTFNNKGSGTVTSVALSLPSIFTVTGSPVTTTGTLTGSLNSQTANIVFAGPSTGSPATPTFRALVSSDIPALNYVTAVSGTSPISVTSGYTPTVSISQASATTNGYLSSTDWNTFNNKGSGTVTSITSTTLSVGGTSAIPTINLTSGIVTAGTTGSSTLIPVITVDTYGRVTNVTTASNPQGTVTSVSGTGSVNGITLTGTVTSSGSLTLGGALSGIGNSQLTNSTISGVALGGNLFNLTAGTGVSFSTGTTYNGSAAITINATGSGGTVTSVAASGGTTGLTFSGSPITTSGTITLGGTLGTGYGGTNLTTYTTGDILYASATNTLSKLAIGTNGYHLTVTSGAPVWKPPYVRTSFTATASQTTFSATYNVGYVQVFMNGVLLNGADYTATNGTSVVLSVAANAGDIVELIAYNV
jgi:hypothetical protein